MQEKVPARLQWACRRGMLELDVLLGNFLNEAYSQLPTDEKNLFENLLTCQDQDLFMWLTGKEISDDPMLQKMVEKVRHHAKTRHSR